MAKKSNHSIIEKKSTPVRTSFNEQYLDMFFFKHRPVNDNFLDLLAEEYVKWFVNNPKALLFTQFLEAKFINRANFYRWLLRSEKLQQAHDFILMLLCNRREVGAMERKLDGNFISKMHGYYSDIWVQETTRIAQLQQQAGTGNQNIIVQMTPFGENKNG